MRSVWRFCEKNRDDLVPTIFSMFIQSSNYFKWKNISLMSYVKNVWLVLDKCNTPAYLFFFLFFQ